MRFPRTAQHRTQFAALAVAVAIGLGFVLTACGTLSSDSAPSQAGSEKRHKIVLSLNNITVSQRLQGANGAAYVARTKYRNSVDFQLKVSEDTVTAQIASLQQIIRDKPDAILVNAASETALTQVLTQACHAGIVVVNFDQQAANVPCAYRRPYVPADYSADAAQWMCKQLNGNGKIYLDQGIAGLPTTTLVENVVSSTFASTCPKVSVVANYQSQYSVGTEIAAVSALLSSHPDVTGVISNAYCTGVIQAFQRAGHTPVPTVCGATNGNAIACSDAKVPCFQWGVPSTTASVALRTAVNVLEGKPEPREVPGYDTDYILNSGTAFTHKLPVSAMTAGKDFFPGQSPDLLLPVTLEDFGITPSVALSGS